MSIASATAGRQRKNTRKWTGIAVILILVSFFYVACMAVFVLSGGGNMDERFRPRSHMPFSQDAWRRSHFGEPSRYKMANDLLDSRKLLGLSESAVRELLGKASSEYYNQGSHFLGYELIHQRAFPATCFPLPRSFFMNTDTWLLEIRFLNGRVISARIIST